jgi:hypothetical protein
VFGRRVDDRKMDDRKMDDRKMGRQGLFRFLPPIFLPQVLEKKNRRK